jgi:hypothetical protein
LLSGKECRDVHVVREGELAPAPRALDGAGDVRPVLGLVEAEAELVVGEARFVPVLEGAEGERVRDPPLRRFGDRRDAADDVLPLLDRQVAREPEPERVGATEHGPARAPSRAGRAEADRRLRGPVQAGVRPSNEAPNCWAGRSQTLERQDPPPPLLEA